MTTIIQQKLTSPIKVIFKVLKHVLILCQTVNNHQSILIQQVLSLTGTFVNPLDIDLHAFDSLYLKNIVLNENFIVYFRDNDNDQQRSSALDAVQQADDYSSSPIQDDEYVRT